MELLIKNAVGDVVANITAVTSDNSTSINTRPTPNHTPAAIIFIGKLVAATFTVFMTTADDAVWLIPYMSTKKYTISAALIHGITFCCALQIVILGCYILIYFFRDLLFDGAGQEKKYFGLFTAEALLGLIAASVCWCIAIGMFIYV